MRSSFKTWKKIRSVDSRPNNSNSGESRAESEENDHSGSVSFFCLFIHWLILDSHTMISCLWGAQLPRLPVFWVYKKICGPLKRKSKKRNTVAQLYRILEAHVFPLPPSLKECPRLFSPIISLRLAAAIRPSCCRLRFFTSLNDEEKSLN